MDDDVELRRLRERVYGAGGDSVTPAMIARLAELEDRVRPSVNLAELPAVDVAGAQTIDIAVAQTIDTAVAQTVDAARIPTVDAAGTPAPADPPGQEGTSTEPAEAEPPAPRPVRRRILTALGAVALVGIGVAIGATATATATASMPGASADPAAAMYPELTYPQTIEDAISADILRDSAIDSGSTRYIATVSDFQIFFAQPDDGDGRCIVTFTATDNRPWTVGCASGAQEGAAVFGIDDGLTVAIGDPDDSQVSGIPIRLSESVTAYVAR